MTCELAALGIDAQDPARLARFWGELLGRPAVNDTELGPEGAAGFRLRFSASPAPKAGQNLIHFDLTSATPEEQQRTVARALELGGRHVDIGQRGDEGHVVLGDPEGNEFCVLEAGNTFLAGCGFLGALNCDGTQAVGYFWSRALEWPLVWDQEEETAIRSPRGGSKITWSGPPLLPRTTAGRMRFELAVSGGSEIDRLVSLGATRLGPDASGRVLLADPDGNEFSVETERVTGIEPA